ncbi:Glycerate 2-kinase [Vibrio stylophorae]|uniref:Glycerate 2-kinase n=1 Tax=Vibrio stylophorae TaxID=659351 RepID=A0ABM8ZSJ2_9VIBR|nr:glycerate kinase [Vibrio stylophorae]CAH0533269.1 Glycerate 2-kinase [Vibrio stylophorae]
MKIVIAPDSYKESLTALQVANAIEAGFRQVFPDAQYIKLPIADGGEGTVQSLVDATQGQIIDCQVTGPLGTQVQAFYGLLGDGKTAVIEMAAASGLHHVPAAMRNPLHTTSYGTGELLRHALSRGVQHIILGIGGSATNDGGAGMAQALGVQLLDGQGQNIGFGGAALAQLARIDCSAMDTRLNDVKLEVACDVTNPLCGSKGASQVFGPQKGAKAQMIAILDGNLAHFADVMARDCGREVRHLPGAGAAGGMGAGLMGLFNANLRAGIEIVADALRLSEIVADADLVITGEGRIDSQTIYGKTPVGVAKIAKRFDVPVIAIAGAMGADYSAVHQHGLDAVFSCVPRAMPLDDALTQATNHVVQVAQNVAMALYVGRSLGCA